MAETPISDELWEQFHHVVNMTSRELREWLVTDEATEVADAYPDQAGSERSRAILGLLDRRRTDMGEQDAELMQQVVEEVTRIRGNEAETAAGDAGWRHRLMSLGHDPLKPTG